MTVFKVFAGMKKAALALAYDNGMINRHESEEQWLAKVAPLLENKPLMSLARLEVWLQGLTDEQVSVLVAGEQTEMKALVAEAPDPEFTDALFNEVFVC